MHVQSWAEYYGKANINVRPSDMNTNSKSKQNINIQCVTNPFLINHLISFIMMNGIWQYITQQSIHLQNEKLNLTWN